MGGRSFFCMRIAFDLHTAQGIGDAVCGLYAAAALHAAGHSIVLSTRHQAWLAGCTAEVGIGDYGRTQLDASVHYQEQLVAQRTSPGINRAQWYIANIAAARGRELASIKPIIPQFKIPLEKPPVDRPYILINPFSAHTERCWPADHFVELSNRLVRAGIIPVGVGSARDARGLQKIFGRVKGSWFFWNQHPSWVRSAMRQGLGFVGNDSGLTHVAASLGVPTVAIVSHIRPSFIFDPAPVTAVVPDITRFACRFCGWQQSAGFRMAKPCLPICGALQSISVQTVFDAVQQTCLLAESAAA